MTTTDSRDEQAKAIFEQFLALEEDRRAPPWFALLAVHPHLASTLEDLRIGHQLLLRAVAANRRRQRQRRLAAAAAVAMAAAAAFLLCVVVPRHSPSTPSPDDPTNPSATSAATPREQPADAPTIADATPTARPAALQPDGMVGSLGYFVAPANTAPPTSRILASAAATRRAVADTLGEPPAGAPTDPDQADADVELEPGLVLLADAALLNNPSAAFQTTAYSRRLLEDLQATNRLKLSVVDLDAGGQPADGLPVYARKVDLTTSTIGPPRYLGTTPLEAAIGIGDFRITIVDRTGSRYSELQVLSAPRTAIPAQLAFLRTLAADDPGSPMVRFGVAVGDNGATTDRSRTPDAAFLLDRYETSIGQYRAFLTDIRQHADRWAGADADALLQLVQPAYLDRILADPEPANAAIEDRAVYGLKWNAAVLFANWQGKRLPTWDEWEWAACGPEGRIYPWGDRFEEGRIAGTKVDGTLPHPRSGPVRAYPDGATPDGVHRLADGVQEWLADVWRAGGSDTGGIPSFRLCLGDPASLYRLAGSHSAFGRPLTAGNAKSRGNIAGYLPGGNFSLVGVRCARSDPDAIRRVFHDR